MGERGNGQREGSRGGRDGRIDYFSPSNIPAIHLSYPPTLSILSSIEGYRLIEGSRCEMEGMMELTEREYMKEEDGCRDK